MEFVGTKQIDQGTNIQYKYGSLMYVDPLFVAKAYVALWGINLRSDEGIISEVGEQT